MNTIAKFANVQIEGNRKTKQSKTEYFEESVLEEVSLIE